MKTLFSAAALCLLLLSCSKDNFKAPRYKNLIFRIYTATPPATTDTTLVELKLRAYVATDSAATPTRVWDTTLLPRRITLFPDNTQPLIVNKNFPDVDDPREQVYITTTTTKKNVTLYQKVDKYNTVPYFNAMTIQVQL